MKDIVIVGGGYAGLYTAWTLEKKLRRGEARVTVLDPRPAMTYQPFLPEVVSGAVDPRHALVPLRRPLRRTRVIPGTATHIDHARRTVHAVDVDGRPFDLRYDTVVVTAGAVTRTFPIPGLTDVALGLKTVEEAVAVRDRILTGLDRAAALPAGPERARLLTVTVVGGGFAGVETIAETHTMATELLTHYPEIAATELSYHLVEAQQRILPEVTEKRGRRVLARLRAQGIHVHLGAQLQSVVDGRVVLSTGEAFESAVVVWTAGNAPAPVVAKHTDLPVDGRGHLLTRADLRVGTEDAAIPRAWAAGDAAAVPDLALETGRTTVPNAQHAVRQAKVLARNLVAELRGRPIRAYVHDSLGVVATLGRGQGIFEYKKIAVTGWLAWAMHRGYHVLAVPTWERKIRVLFGWAAAWFGGREAASLPLTGPTPLDRQVGSAVRRTGTAQQPEAVAPTAEQAA